jgi:hypothetical protein
MAKCQQMDCYVKPRTEGQSPNVGVDDPPGHPHNYDPRGWNAFEEDALVLRDFFDSLVDYPNLWFDGRVASAPVVAQVRRHAYVLSSEREAVGYVSSDTAEEGVRFPAGDIELDALATDDGTYDADVVDPVEGVVGEQTVDVADGAATVAVPAFTDDVAVHLY